MTNESSKWLYKQLSDRGYNVGQDELEFDSLMQNNAESRKWAFDTAGKEGLNVGDFAEFESLMGAKVAEPVKTEDISGFNDSKEIKEEDYTFTERELMREKPGVADTVADTMRRAQNVEYDRKSEEKANEAVAARQLFEKNKSRERLQEIGKRAGEVVDKHDEGLFGIKVPQVVENTMKTNPVVWAGDIVTDYVSGLFDKDVRAARAAKTKAEEAEDMIQEASHNGEGFLGTLDKQVGGVLRGIADAATRVGTWDFGVTDTAESLSVANVVDKWEKGEELTPVEQDLIDAVGLTAAAQAAYQDKIGVGYKVGQSLPESAGFMASMYLNPASGLAKAAVKKYGTTTARKIAARVAGDASEMAVITGTTGLGRVVNDAVERMHGQDTYDVDENGIIRYGGAVEQEKAADAIMKALGSQFIENYSESLGEYFTPLGDFIGAVTTKGLKKGGLDKFVDALQTIKSSQWSRAIQTLKEKTKFNGLMGEYMEEVAGNMLNAATVGDMTFSNPEDETSVFNPETNLITFLSCAAMSGTLYAVEAGGNKLVRNAINSNVTDLDRRLSESMGDAWQGLKKQIDASSPEGMARWLDAVNNTEEYTDEHKALVRDYAGALVKMQAFNSREVENKEEQVEGAKVNPVNDEKNGSDVTDVNGELSGGAVVAEEANPIQERRDAAYDRGIGVVDDNSLMIELNYDVEMSEERVGRVFAGASDEASAVRDAVMGTEDMAEADRILQTQGGVLTDRQREALDSWIDSREAMRGAGDGMQRQVTAYGEQRRAEIENMKSQSGEVVPLVLDTGETVYLKSGDLNARSGSVYVSYANGETAQIPTRSIAEVGRTEDAEAMYSREISEYEDGLIEKYNGIANGEVFIPGDEVSISLNGAPTAVMVMGADEAGNIVFAEMETGRQIALPIAEASQAFRESLDMRKQALLLEEDAKEQEATQQKVLAQAEERLSSGIVGYADGKVDLSAVETDAEVAADYLHTMDEVRAPKQTLTDIETEKERLAERERKINAQLKRQQQWMDANGDLYTEEERAEQQRAIDELQGEISDVRARQQKLVDVRNAYMTAEQRTTMAKERTDHIEDMRKKKEESLDEWEVPELPIAMPTEESLASLETPEKKVNEVRRQRLNLQQYNANEVQPRITAIDKRLEDYQNGRIDLTDEEINSLLEQRMRYEDMERAVLFKQQELKALQDKLSAVRDEYVKAETEDTVSEPDSRAKKLAQAKSHKELAKLAKEVYGDELGDLEPQTLEEYVASSLRPHSISYEGRELENGTVLGGIQQELGYKRGGFGKKGDTGAIDYFLAAKGKGESVDAIAEGIWSSLPEQMQEQYDSQDVKNALLDVLSGAERTSDITRMVLNNRIADAEQRMRYMEEEQSEYERQEAEAQNEIELYREIFLSDLKENPLSDEDIQRINGIFVEAAMLEDERRNNLQQSVKKINTEDNDTGRVLSEVSGAEGGSRMDKEHSEGELHQGSGEGEAVVRGEQTGEPETNVQHPGRQDAVTGRKESDAGNADVDRKLRLSDEVSEGEGGVEKDASPQPSPVGKGAFGDIYDQFRGKAAQAIDFLRRLQSGEALGALHHKDVGDIALVWGDMSHGLSHIILKHPEIADNLQGIIDEMHVTSSSDNRIVLESDTHKAVVSKNWLGENTDNWLLTAYEKKRNASGGSIDIVPEPMQGKQNGTTPLQDTSSEGKDTQSSGNKQGKGEEIAEEAYQDGKNKRNGYHGNNGKPLRTLEDVLAEGESAEGQIKFRRGDGYTEEIEVVNERYNQRLRELDADPTQKDRVLRLGRAGDVLRRAGIADAEIEMEYDRFVRKSGGNYENAHPFTSAEIQDLPKAINAPIAVFDSADSKVVLTELQKDGKNFIVAIRTKKQNRKGGVVLEVNEITTLYPKNAKGIVNWINTDKGLFYDKQKTLHWVEALRPLVGTTITNEEFNSAAKIIENFENPKVSTENNSATEQQRALGEVAVDLLRGAGIVSGNQIMSDNNANDIDAVNERFNEQLEGLTEENADSVAFDLGRPSAVLRAAGVEDMPMKLYGNKVIKKMKKHGFSLEELRDLPNAVANPIAVFNNYQKEGNRSVLTELQVGDKHILVSITIGKKGVDADFNIISSVFGKGQNNIIDWIKKGYATYINIEKTLDYLHFSERSISEASNSQELLSVAKIVENFENPKNLEEKNESNGNEGKPLRTLEDVLAEGERRKELARKKSEDEMVNKAVADFKDKMASAISEAIGKEVNPEEIAITVNKKGAYTQFSDDTQSAMSALDADKDADLIYKMRTIARDTLLGLRDLLMDRADKEGNFVAESQPVFGKRKKGAGRGEKELSLFDSHTFVSGDEVMSHSGELPTLEPGEFSLVQREFNDNGYFGFSGGKVESADDVAYILRNLEDKSVENAFAVLVTDGKPTIVHLGMGGFAETYANVASIKAAVDKFGAEQIYFVHNHPSGNLTSSAQDRNLLATLKGMFGNKLQKGIIIDTTSGLYGVFNDAGSVNARRWRAKESKGEEQEIVVKEFDKLVFSKDYDVNNLQVMNSSDKVAAFISSQRLGERKKMGVIILDQSMRMVGNFHLPYADLTSDVDNLAEELVRLAINGGGRVVIPYGNFPMNSEVTNSIGKKVKELSGRTVSIIDIVTNGEYDYSSAADNGFYLGESAEGQIKFRRGDGYTEEIEVVNERFNEQLEGLTEENADSVAFDLGRPSAVLRAAGVEDMPMKLYGNKVIKKMKKHGFSLEELRDLPNAVANPIAVFNNYQKEGNRSVLTELKTAQGNFLVTIDLGKSKDLDFNIVSSVFGKSDNKIVDWLNKGLATYINKEKALEYLRISAPIAEAQSNQEQKKAPESQYYPAPIAETPRLQELLSAAKIVENFENPNILKEKNGNEGNNESNGNEGPLSEVERARAVAEAVAVGEQLGGVSVVAEDETSEIPAEVKKSIGEGTVKGWFDPSDGSVHLYVPAIDGVEDAQRTVFHEKLGHEGLKALLGSDEAVMAWGQFVFDSASKDIRKRIIERADEEGFGWDDHQRFSKAAQEVFSDIASEGPRSADEFSLWRKVKYYLAEALRRLGIRVRGLLNDHDMRYYVLRTGSSLSSNSSPIGKESKARAISEEDAVRGDILYKREKRPEPLDTESKADYIRRLREWTEIQDAERRKREAEKADAEVEPEMWMRDVNTAITESKLLFAEFNAANTKARKDALSAVYKDLRALANAMAKSVNQKVRETARTVSKDISGATRAQMKYDRATVNTLIDAVRMFVRDDNLDKISREDLNKVLAAIKKANGKQNIEKELWEIKVVLLRNLQWKNMDIRKRLSALEKEEEQDSDDVKLIKALKKLEKRIQSKEKKIAKGLKAGDKDVDEKKEVLKSIYQELNETVAQMSEEISELAKETAQDMVETAKEAAQVQKKYDKGTVQAVVTMARMLMRHGYLDPSGVREVGRLLTLVKNATGKNDASKEIQGIMDLMVDNVLRSARADLEKSMKTKETKLDSTGVEVQGKLDLRGQQAIKTMREYMDKPKEQIDERMAVLLEQMESKDDAAADQAYAEYVGLSFAKEYADGVAASETEADNLDKDIEAAQNEYNSYRAEVEAKIKALDENIARVEDEMSKVTDNDSAELQRIEGNRKAYRAEKKAWKEKLASRRQALADFKADAISAKRMNLLERAEAMRNLSDRVAEKIAESRQAAKDFLITEIERAKAVRRDAMRDLDGVPEREQTRTVWKDNLVNFIAKFSLSPLRTFDQLLRLIGRKSADGRGYLWNRLMRQWKEATEKEYRGMEAANNALDAKASEVMGKKTRWSKLYKISNKLTGIEAEFWNGTDLETIPLTQGNALYIYMANKMADGAMKLRWMGISEAQVEQITEKIDPRLIALADWIQGEYLPSLRNKYNRTHERLFGASMASVENYFPLRINKGSRQSNEDIGMTSTDGETPADKTGSIIKRTRNRLPLNVVETDAISLVIEHIQAMEHWNAFAEFNRDANTLINDNHFKNRLKGLRSMYGAGEKLVENFINTVKVAAGTYAPKRSELDAWIINLAKGVSTAKISFRLYTALKQITSGVAFLPDVDKKEFLKQLWINASNPKKSWDWAMKELPLFDKRWLGRVAGNEKLMPDASDWSIWRTWIVEKGAQAGMYANAFIDALTVACGAHAVYRTSLARYKKEGYSDFEAEEKAKMDAMVSYNQTQQSSESAFLSPMQADRTLTSTALTVFMNNSFAYARRLYRGVADLSKMSKKGFREESVDFMAKQMEEEGAFIAVENEEERRALTREAAEKRYQRAKSRAMGDVATFGFFAPFAFNIMSYMPDILLGGAGDDDENVWRSRKWEYIVNAAIDAVLGGAVEGTAGGSVISDLLSLLSQGKGLSNFDPTLLPIAGDIKKLRQDFDRDTMIGLTDLVNLGVQMGIGANPQILSDFIVAVYDYADGDMGIAAEIEFLLMRILQVPESQQKEIYLDEIKMNMADARKLSPMELAKRSANYYYMRKLGVLGFIEREAKDAAIAKQTQQFMTKAKERANTWGDADVNAEFDKMAEEMKEAGKKISTYKGLQGTEPEKSAEKLAKYETLNYVIVSKYKNLVDERLKQAVEAVDEESQKEIMRQVGKLKADAVMKYEGKERADYGKGVVPKNKEDAFFIMGNPKDIELDEAFESKKAEVKEKYGEDSNEYYKYKYLTRDLNYLKKALLDPATDKEEVMREIRKVLIIDN